MPCVRPGGSPESIRHCRSRRAFTLLGITIAWSSHDFVETPLIAFAEGFEVVRIEAYPIAEKGYHEDSPALL